MLRFPKEDGFTLMEMLIVLSIIIMLVSFSFFHVRAVYQARVIQQFFEQLQQDIWLGQQYAISHSKGVELTFYETEDFYDIREGGVRSLIVKRTIKSEVKLRPLTITNPIKFNAGGNINSPGSMYVTYHHHTYKVTFLLGRGRFRIEKL
ncbi:competence type IV pilus minor pilin ComGD [Bacillus sp. AK128]